MNLRKFNWFVIQNLNKIFKTTIFDETYWRFRRCKGDWKEGGYWESVDHPHRQVIIDILKKKYPDGNFSLAEIGCNSGPNLINLEQHFAFIPPHTAGIDINCKAVEEGKEQELNIQYGKADKLPWPDKSFDVALADAVCMYIGPRKIRKVIEEMIRVAKEMIVIVDFHKADGDVKGHIELGHWVRDYQALFAEYGYKAKLRKITKEMWPSYSWEKLGYFITVDLKKYDQRKRI